MLVRLRRGLSAANICLSIAFVRFLLATRAYKATLGLLGTFTRLLVALIGNKRVNVHTQFF